MPMGCDVVVVGLGAMGAGTIWNLARRGLKVIGVERFDRAHAFGSSHGVTRICRQAYFEHPDYVPLCRRAYTLWDELESDAGRFKTRETEAPNAQRLFERCGLLMFGEADSPMIDGARRVLDVHNVRIDRLQHDAVRDRWPQFDIDGSLECLFEPDAGYLRVEPAIRTLLGTAEALGATVLTDTPVRDWSVDARGVRVDIGNDTIEADRLIVTAGAWSGRILRDLGVRLTVLRKPQLWFECHDPRYADCPVFAYQTQGAFFYGFPTVEPGLIKLAEHTGREVVDDPDALDRALRPSDIERVAAFAGRRLGGVSNHVLRHSVCMYTMTPDERFVIDRHPEYDSVSFAAGFSGHGFKFAPLVGSILADLATAGATDEPIEFLRLSRSGLR
ncbi:MAG: N-methyl-L-tryptophan oxidase [Phycisphaerales bacterium]|nr:N-methyl-L-tryptophan oxidase [Phycisphaerales bacterium]